MSYELHFGLTEQPFSNAADGRFFFESEQHQEAMLRIQHSVSTMKGLTVAIGGPGAGKTLLARRVLEKLEEKGDEYEAALLVIVHSEVNADWLLRKIATQLGVAQPAEHKADLLPQLFDRLCEINAAGRKACVLIDEANMLHSREIFEEFRGLSNLELPGRKLISIVLFGLPELQDNMACDPPLVQRIAVRVGIKPFDATGTGNYVRHRMSVAGSQADVFELEALMEVHHISQGVPRVINTLCDNALLEAFLLKKHRVNAETIRGVASDLGLATK